MTIERVHRQLECVLTDEEVQERSTQQAATWTELKTCIETKKSVASSYASKQKNLESELDRLGAAVTDHKETRSVPCQWYQNFTRGKMVLVRMDTGAEIEERNMNESDRQPQLNFVPPTREIEEAMNPTSEISVTEHGFKQEENPLTPPDGAESFAQDADQAIYPALDKTTHTVSESGMLQGQAVGVAVITEEFEVSQAEIDGQVSRPSNKGKDGTKASDYEPTDAKWGTTDAPLEGEPTPHARKRASRAKKEAVTDTELPA